MRFFNRELRKSRIVMASLLVREFFGFFLLCIFVFSAHISLCAFAIHVCLLLYTFPSVSQSRGNRVLPEGTVLVLLLRLSACTVLVTAEASRPLCELNKWVFPPGFETPSPGGRFLCKFNPPPPRHQALQLHPGGAQWPGSGHLWAPGSQQRTRPGSTGWRLFSLILFSKSQNSDPDPGLEMRSREAAPESMLLPPPHTDRSCSPCKCQDLSAGMWAERPATRASQWQSWGQEPRPLAGHGKFQVQKSQVIEASIRTRGMMEGWGPSRCESTQGDRGRMSGCLAPTHFRSLGHKPRGNGRTSEIWSRNRDMFLSKPPSQSYRQPSH